jgi:Sec-independent protein secretion pathway component TatC
MQKYFLEMKNRFFLLCITWLSILFVSYVYKETLLFTVIQPNLSLNYYKDNFYFIFTNILEVFIVYLKLILFLSLQISFIYLFYHIFIFLSSGLFYLEYLYFKFFIKIASVV